MNYVERVKLRAMLRLLEGMVAVMPGISLRSRGIIQTYIALHRAVIKGNRRETVEALGKALKAIDPEAHRRISQWFEERRGEWVNDEEVRGG